MGFLSDLIKGKKPPPSPLHQWGLHGSRVTRNFIRGQRRYDQRQRKSALKALSIQKGALTKGFDQQIKMTQRDAQRGASARGLGKSTIGMAIAPTMQLNMQRNQGLADIKSARAQMPRVPSHYYKYMGKKAQYGALEPFQSYLSSTERQGGIFGSGGMASMFGQQLMGNLAGAGASALSGGISNMFGSMFGGGPKGIPFQNHGMGSYQPNIPSYLSR
jgi:hypothetical protein